MNLAVRGIDADIRWNNEGSFHKDELPDLKADFILANPPFNVSDWGGDRLADDQRWRQVRMRGSHRQFRHPRKPGTVTVAGKPSDDLSRGTWNSIVKQAKLGG